MLSFRLAFSNLSVHRVRCALTISAIALAVSLVVAVTSGYHSAYAAAQKMLSQYIGSTDAQVTRRNEAHGGIDEALIDTIASDPAVERADGRLELEFNLMNGAGTLVGGRSAQIIGLNRPHDVAVDAMKMETGRWFETIDGDSAVVDQVAAERLAAQLGTQFQIPAIGRTLKLKVVGIVHKPTMLAEAIQSVYVPLHTLQEFALPDKPRQVSRVLIIFKRGVDEKAFYARMSEQLAKVDPLLKLRLSSDNRKEMDKNLLGLHMLSYLGGAVSMLSATFIVFSVLSMGVTERQRTLAMLRAIGAFRAQIGKLVIAEGVLLAGAGAAVGVPLGILWIHLLAWKFSNLFSAGAVISFESIAFAVIGTLLAALGASLLPALSAMRLTPLEAMTPLARPGKTRGIVLAALGGAVLMCLDPLILWMPADRVFGTIGIPPPQAHDLQFLLHLTVGMSGIMIGFFLAGPLVVTIVERVIGPIIAPLFGLKYSMLRQQLSGGVWRAAGTCAALMVGLSILIVMQTQGTTAIRGWKLPDKFPDLFIFSSTGLSPSDEAKLSQVPGIRNGEVMPIAIASPQFGASMLALISAAIVPDATMFFGVDPARAFDMMELEFRDGSNVAEARELLKKGKYLIVTEEYRAMRNLTRGDKLKLKTTEGETEFTIAGVVWSPGIDVLVSAQDMSIQFDQRTAASLFGSVEDARKYFGVERVHLYAANLQTGVDKNVLLKQLQTTLGEMGLRVSDVRQIKFGIQQVLARLLMLASTIAYAALAVASFGVTNTIMASIRTRRWEFGILRSIGFTRSQLLRLILAEAALLGVVGVVLGWGAGFEMALDARRAWAHFFGYSPPAVVPWATVLIGSASVMVVALLASIWPAIHVARTQPLSLLQAGRSAS